jgi:hypothetical protein
MPGTLPKALESRRGAGEYPSRRRVRADPGRSRLDSITEFLRHVRKSCRRRRRIATPASRATETDRSRVGRRMDDRYSDAVTGGHVTQPTPGAAAAGDSGVS